MQPSQKLAASPFSSPVFFGRFFAPFFIAGPRFYRSFAILTQGGRAALLSSRCAARRGGKMLPGNSFFLDWLHAKRVFPKHVARRALLRRSAPVNGRDSWSLPVQRR